MRVATWNINGLRARFDLLLHWLRARKPDIVGLQELKLEEQMFPFAELEAEGYCAVVHAQKAWNGVAILSRTAAQEVQKGLPSQEEQGARLVDAEIGELTFTTIYCPNGKHIGHQDFTRKLEWLDSLVFRFEGRQRRGGTRVLCGDFNICPTALDSWDEEGHRGQIFHTDAERLRFRRLLDSGLVDVYRELHPETPAFSWWDYRAGSFHKNRGLRIDLLLATPAVVARVREAGIDREYRKKKDGLTPSDHAPVIVDLE